MCTICSTSLLALGALLSELDDSDSADLDDWAAFEDGALEDLAAGFADFEEVDEDVDDLVDLAA